MSLSRRKFTACAAAIIAAPAIPAYAHREKTTLSEVTWNPDSGFLYVTHSFHTHEAEQALYAAGVISSPKFESLRSRAQLALYTETKFSLKTLGNDDIALELIGAEIDGPDVYVFQQARLTSAPKGLIITCALLRSLIPEQINTVDVRLSSRVVSLDFRGHEMTKKALA